MRAFNPAALEAFEQLLAQPDPKDVESNAEQPLAPATRAPARRVVNP